jgi:hypothetical protein
MQQVVEVVEAQALGFRYFSPLPARRLRLPLVLAGPVEKQETMATLALQDNHRHWG